MAVDGDTLVGKAPVEMFPTTISLTPDGELAFVANSDFHGDHPRMNVVSIVYTPQMITLTNLPACDMPHGVKVNHAGTKVYVTCMNSDEVLEIDRRSEEHTSELQSQSNLVCRLLLEKKKYQTFCST